MRKYAVVVIGVLVLAAALTVLLVPKHTSSPQNNSPSGTSGAKTRAEQDVKTDMAPAIRAAIMAEDTNDPSLTQGVFTVTSTSEPVTGWLIATITPSNPNSDTSTVLLRRSGRSSLDIVAGPGTSFAKSVLDQAGVPAAVQNQLTVFDDETQ